MGRLDQPFHWNSFTLQYNIHFVVSVGHLNARLFLRPFVFTTMTERSGFVLYK